MSRSKLLFLLLASLAPLMAQRQGPYDCTKTYVTTTAITSSGVTSLIPVPTNQMIRICHVSVVVVQPSTPANFGLIYGTGGTCGTGAGSQTPLWTGVATSIQNYSKQVPYGTAWFVPYNNGLCLSLSANVTSAQVEILYDLY